ncbi:MAG: hypothetical protein D6738_04645 [Acidobacteria bacterium]|nr:MAG: hypothetical protein D6738_04645 [Acidobacteriota bacterium]
MSDTRFTPTNIRADLDTLTKLMKRLSVEYEMFFSQQVRWPPWQRQAECDAIIRHYQKNPPRQTADRFRFNTLVHRYRTTLERFSRRRRQLEEKGMIERRGQRRSALAERESVDVHRPQTLVSQTARAGRAQGDQVRDLYRAYRDARRARGQEIRKLTYAPFAEKIERLLSKARAQAGGRDVELQLTEADGRVTVAVRPVRRK